MILVYDWMQLVEWLLAGSAKKASTLNTLKIIWGILSGKEFKRKCFLLQMTLSLDEWFFIKNRLAASAPSGTAVRLSLLRPPSSSSYSYSSRDSCLLSSRRSCSAPKFLPSGMMKRWGIFLIYFHGYAYFRYHLHFDIQRRWRPCGSLANIVALNKTFYHIYW